MDKDIFRKAVKVFDKQYPKLKSKKEYCFEYNGLPTIVIEHNNNVIGEDIFFAVDLSNNKIQPFNMNPIVVENLSKRGDNLGLIKIQDL